MKRGVGWLMLGASAAGAPVTDLVLRRGGRRGALLAETVCAGLALRDLAMVVGGTPRRLPRIPAALLVLELAAATVATTVGLRPVLARRGAEDVLSPRARATQRLATDVLFALHTVRLHIYLGSDTARSRG
jgi:hypothetical protein